MNTSAAVSTESVRFAGRVAFAGQAGQPRASRLRLTRRGRVVFGSLATVLVAGLLAIAALFGSSQAVASAEPADVEFEYVAIPAGATLWSVATALDPAADPRDVIAELVRLNQLGDSAVQAGQVIAVPLRYSDVPGVVPAAELGIVVGG